LCQLEFVGAKRHGLRVRNELMEPRPGADVLGVAYEAGVDPTQGLDKAAMRCASIQAAAGHILHEAVNREPGFEKVASR
jgi:hypothetical protein